MNDLLTKKQRTNLEKEIDSRWEEVLGMKGFNPFVFLPDDIKSKLRKEYIRVIKEIVFIKKAKIIHGDKYNYKFVYYVNARTKVIIICPIHGEFEQTPDNHLRGCACNKCGNENSSKKRRKSQEKFEKLANEIHDHKYTYFGDYVNSHTKIKIWCKKHKYFFWQTPTDHLQGKACPKCGLEKRIKSRTKSQEQFEKQANEIHNHKYIYFGDYINAHTEIKIWCKKHKEFFWQTPDNHLRGKGCPRCKQSKGEMQIEKYLKQNNIKYEIQKRFRECKNKQTLPFDFYLPDYDLLIEFQGMQHYQIPNNNYFGGEDGFKQRQKRDQIKRDFCNKPENPDLLEIKYDQINNINQLLKEKIS